VDEEWYTKITADGLLDELAPYGPVIVGVYPLQIAGPEDQVEIVCRAIDLPAFARALEKTHGHCEDFAAYGGSLDSEDAVFCEFSLDGLAVQVAAQPEHVNKRLGRATLGIDRVLTETGDVARSRLASKVAKGQDWLDAAMEQFNLTRAALESLATANPGLVRQVMGIKGPRLPVAAYVPPLVVGIAADALIVFAGWARGSQNFTGVMLVLEAALLGFLFGARLGIVGAVTPLLAAGIWLGAPLALGNSNGCGGDCGTALVGYVFLLVLVVSASGFVGALRDRYRPIGTSSG
jgi:hypothetical protein